MRTSRYFLGKLRVKIIKNGHSYSFRQQRNLLTIAIETSCDDTSVAVLEKHANNSATLHFNSKITSDNRTYGGIHPIVAHESHQKNLANLIRFAFERFPEEKMGEKDTFVVGHRRVRKPNFVTVTRGPGMRASLITGIDTAKGLAVGLQIPLVGVNHMQAHALTPRLVSAIKGSKKRAFQDYPMTAEPKFPFLSLLVSGGHTMLVHSESIWNHTTLANTNDISLGDMLDKSARAILPASYTSQVSDVMYGRALEEFAYPSSSFLDAQHQYVPPKTVPIVRHGITEEGHHWKITPPYMYLGAEGTLKYSNQFSFSGIGSRARSVMKEFPNVQESERRYLAKAVMTVAFEHLGSRVLFALKRENLSNIKVLVVSGGVASNKLLRTILRALLDTCGFPHIHLVIPSPELCSDNAAMIAWSGMEIFEAGYSTDLSASALKEWSIDPKSDDGGILGAKGWDKNEKLISRE